MESDKKYTCLAEYFHDHPDEENSYYDDMAQMAEEEKVEDLPEDWRVTDASH